MLDSPLTDRDPQVGSSGPTPVAEPVHRLEAARLELAALDPEALIEPINTDPPPPLTL